MDPKTKPTAPPLPNTPYEAHRETAAWRAIEEAIDVLVDNDDIVEKTRRDYIVGLICEKLRGIVTAQSMQKLKEKA